MQFDASLSKDSAKRTSIEIDGGLTYNADQTSIEGVYPDELSLHRAKRTWCSVLETDFLLIPNADFKFNLSTDQNNGQFLIACSFTSACGRYAFWRLINEQVPEVQFLLETAHMSHRYKDYSSLIGELDSTPVKGLFQSVRLALKQAVSQIKQLVK